MFIKQVTTKDDLIKGDIILIDDGSQVFAEKVQSVKVTAQDGIEIIYNSRKNKYFDLGMYINSESWVKDLRVVKTSYDK